MILWFYKIKKSKLGTHFQRASGKIKPVKNLKTEKVYESTMESARKENLPLSTIRLCCTSGKMLKDGTRFAYLNIDDEPILTEGHGKAVYVGDRKKKYNFQE